MVHNIKDYNIVKSFFLYDLHKMCNAISLSVKVEQLGWSIFGHVLWILEQTPAQKSLEFTVIGSNNYQTRKGRHCTNLLDELRVELQRAGLEVLRSVKRLRELRTLANESTEWFQRKKD